MAKRFTIDGSDVLEASLATTCEAVAEAVLGAVPERRVEAIVLGGGYGRGQGGVLRAPDGDAPYNDLEFYVFLRGNRILNTRRYAPVLHGIAEDLSARAGLHVEFKVDSLRRLRATPVSMFSYDLVTAHKIIFGRPDVFNGCERHLEATAIPVSEATRLLFNRCTGLLLAKEMLLSEESSPEKSDFIARNIAKAQLALGDAILTREQQYHWSVLERHERLTKLRMDGAFLSVVGHHSAGVAFKLHPARSSESPGVLARRHGEVATLAKELWLDIEGRRLGRAFASPRDYSTCVETKCNGTPAWMNYALNLRTFGWRAAMDPAASRYPRERLLKALPVLLWEGRNVSNEGVRELLHARSSDWSSLVAAYKEVWPAYG